MDMTEVEHFSALGFKKEPIVELPLKYTLRKLNGPSGLLLWMADQLRRPGSEKQIVGKLFDNHGGFCALGKIWHANFPEFISYESFDMQARHLFGADIVQKINNYIANANDDGASFEGIAVKLELWAFALREQYHAARVKMEHTCQR